MEEMKKLEEELVPNRAASSTAKSSAAKSSTAKRTANSHEHLPRVRIEQFLGNHPTRCPVLACSVAVRFPGTDALLCCNQVLLEKKFEEQEKALLAGQTRHLPTGQN